MQFANSIFFLSQLATRLKVSSSPITNIYYKKRKKTQDGQAISMCLQAIRLDKHCLSGPVDIYAEIWPLQNINQNSPGDIC